MKKTIKIQHGRPAHEFFMICLPASKIPYGEKVNWDNRPGFDPLTYELQDPKQQGIKIKAELVDVWKTNLNDAEGKHFTLALLAYGISMKKLRYVLLKKYPVLRTNPTIEFLLLKQL